MKIKRIAKPVDINAYTYPWRNLKVETQKLLNILWGIYVLTTHVGKKVTINVIALGIMAFTKVYTLTLIQLRPTWNSE